MLYDGTLLSISALDQKYAITHLYLMNITHLASSLLTKARPVDACHYKGT
jgi:hypothetical protein